MSHRSSWRHGAGVLSLLFAVSACSPGGGAAPPETPAPAGGEPPPEQMRTDTAAGAVPMEAVSTERADRPVVPGVDLDTVQAGRFDQGKMWTFEYPPMDYLRDRYGLEPDSAWFRKARLGALRIPGCSASFVSPNGLVLTNHHCARSFVTQVSDEGENLLDEGFYARSLDAERELEDFHADQLVEIVDITDRVAERTAGLTGANLSEARQEALEDIASEMQEERGGEEAGVVVEAISLYNGALASAYVFRRYENGRLVMAPELQIGFFGGDPDNFTYPRYNLDFAFIRIYDDEGEPLESETYFRWADEGVEDGDVVFIIGNPGSTSRLQTVAELEFRRDIGDAYVLDFIESRIEVLDEFIEANPEAAETYDLRNALFSLQNQQKAMTGQIAGLRDPVILARRGAAQEALVDSLQADPELAEEYGDLFAEMAEVQEEKRELAPGFGSFLGLTAENFASPTLHRALLAFQVLNLQRAGGPSEQLESLLEQLRGVEDRPAELDEALIRARIEDFLTRYGRDGWVGDILEGRSPEGAATVIREESVLSDSASAVQAVENGRLEASDPALRFVRAYVPAFGQFQQGLSGITQREEAIGRRIGQARYDVYGTTQPPDATFSLRLADGVVEGYPYNGTVAPAHTTLFGLYDRYHSFADSYADPTASPWYLPERWRPVPDGLALETPLNFVSTADIIGGNSGSPVVNEFLQLVGVVFDGNIESLPGDYIYLPELNRSVSVDARGILESLDVVYDMDRLVLELTAGRLVPTEEEADAVR